jgi:hypothetical protein
VQLSGALRRLTLGAFVVGSTPALSACVSVSEHGYYDDYPYPPAHPPGGYWYDYYRGYPDLYFDSWLGLYSIHGYPHHYFHDGYFYRWHSGHWSRSRNWGRGWEDCEARHLPHPLHGVHDRPHRRDQRVLAQPWRERADGHGDRVQRREWNGRRPRARESRWRWNGHGPDEARSTDPGSLRGRQTTDSPPRAGRARAESGRSDEARGAGPRTRDRARGADRPARPRPQRARGVVTRSQTFRPQRSR